jgi:hypothetical protein
VAKKDGKGDPEEIGTAEREREERKQHPDFSKGGL